MKTRLHDYALLAEIISAVAIVSSLIFVGLQLRQNDKTSQVNAYQELTNQTISILMSIAEDEKLTEIFLATVNNEDLTTIEFQRIFLIRLSQIRQGELAFLQYENGFIEEGELQILLSGLRAGWNHQVTIGAWGFARKSKSFEEYMLAWLGYPQSETESSQ